eukprot:TRINITY_DN8329_c0_g1_i18.p1 TRINITY_DN8329_c0_g1~~TRINITY_DN8329_c0_g1_i18.p1  ORF type:complete len:598 (+),score=131.92 TRINITY_DN8329_c0_g1_i18:73-1866(+)
MCIRDSCTTAAGVPVDCLTIAAPEKVSRQYVVVTARIHAAEIPGSGKVEGILEFLVGEEKVAEALRKRYNFVVVPMLNPDGVVMGNTRYSVEGDDLNRCWDNPLPGIHPAIYSLKEMLKGITVENEIKMYCDLHGHSKRYGSFIYACHHVANATQGSWLSTRLLTRIMSQKCKMFDYHQCLYSVKPDKQNTGRVIVWKEFKVMNSFTLESSVCGYEEDSRKCQFTDSDYAEIGRALMLSLHEYGILLGKFKGTKGTRPVWDEAKDECRKKKEAECCQAGKGEVEMSVKKGRTMSSESVKNSSNAKKKLAVGVIKILQGKPLVEEYIEKTELENMDSSGLMQNLNISRLRNRSYISNSELCSRKYANRLNETEAYRTPLKPNIIGMQTRIDPSKRSTADAANNLRTRLEQSRIEFNITRKTPIEIKFTNTTRKKPVDSIARTGIFFNPHNRVNAEVNDVVCSSEVQSLAGAKGRSQCCKGMNKTQVKETRGLGNKAAGVSSFLTPTRVREKTTKNAGLINFARKLGKSKMKGMLYNHKLAQIMLYRHRRIKAFDCFEYPKNTRISFADLTIAHPAASRSSSYYASAENGLFRRENANQ